ncbi:phage scaffolding protein [Scatolibacter rhodanostii]|uniref:phage scaffolding protein n=1 Tax=Scatolibacter rhodanostii TaxID=2014781 RepID=UPI00135671A6|nr:phage scaffolding protein [Scatolibacter rhodanostii]
MKTEELTALGLTEEQATQVFAMHGKELTKLQNNVTTLTTERDGYKTQLDTANTKLTGYDPEWKTKADTAQQDAQKQLEALKFDYALNDALKAAKVRDTVSVKAHLKKDALKLDGDSVLGLKEQLETLKTEKDFLFETEEKPPKFSTGTPGVQTDTEKGKEAANNALRQLFGRNGD